MLNKAFIELFGDVNSFSPGTGMIMADRQIKRALERDEISIDEIGNAKAVARLRNGKWFILFGGWDYDENHTAMLGAALGDVAGSVYEWHNIKRKIGKDELIQANSFFTDDTVMTCAVAAGLSEGLRLLPKDWLNFPNSESALFYAVQKKMQQFGRLYPHAGYGGHFRRWISSENPHPYGSWGNGSAMRASYAGWAANSLEEAEKLGEISAKVTHDHPEGIKGAVVVAGCIYKLRSGASKADVREYAGKYYDLNFTLDEIRPDYSFDVSCMGSVPQALNAFFEGNNFVDVISNAISIGGDSDTIAAIAGGIAEAIYPIPQSLRSELIYKLDDKLRRTIADAVDFFILKNYSE